MTEDKEWFSKIDNQKLMNILIQELETNCDTFYKPTEEDLLRRKDTQELFPASGPVKTQIIGNVDIEKEEQAKRVKEFMNYQVTEQMPEYFDEIVTRSFLKILSMLSKHYH